jgi:hypothetical protein
MRNTDEQTPIRNRWVAQSPGCGDEAIAGALLRSAAQTCPLGERNLAEIHARLRGGHRSRSRSVSRPARRLLRQVVVAVGLISFGGVLSAAVSHVIQRTLDRTNEAQTAVPSATKKPVRRVRARSAKPDEPSLPAPEAPAENPTPEAPAETSAPALPALPPETRHQEQAADRPVEQPAKPPTRPTTVRLPQPSRPFALKEAPSLRRSEPGPSWLEPAPAVQPLPAPSELARESRLLASAIAKLRQEGDAEAALAILDRHAAEFGSGALLPEATATRIEALLRLGRNSQALALLDAQSLSAQGVGRKMLVARAELRADKGRNTAALADFDLLLSAWGRSDAVAERAVYGRAVCRAKCDDWNGARRDFEKYLATFPQGRFAAQARAALALEHR